MFKKIVFQDDHQFEKLVDISVHKICLESARNTSLKKLINTIDTWQTRHPNAKVLDLLFGDYAKNVVKQYILFKNANIKIIEYDQIKSDIFVNRDLFDLKIGEDEIEVKSSLEKYTRDLPTINTKRNIIVNRHSSHVSEARYIFQVFYIPKDLKSFIAMEEINAEKSRRFNKDLFEEHLKIFSLDHMDVYICGWIINDKKAKDSFGVSNSKTGAKFRSYASMPINESQNPETFLSLY